MRSVHISASSVPTVAQRVRPANAKLVAPKQAMQSLAKTALAAGAAVTIALAPPALADLNKYEYNAGGEFGVGSALQYGEADLKNRDFSKQDLTRSNFTAADCRSCNFTYVSVQLSLCVATFLQNTLAPFCTQGLQAHCHLLYQERPVQGQLHWRQLV